MKAKRVSGSPSSFGEMPQIHYRELLVNSEWGYSYVRYRPDDSSDYGYTATVTLTRSATVQMTLTGMTILEVDDCEAHNYALTRMLEKAGCKVLRAFTGSDAIRLALQKPDAVLLDINLPDLNGFEVCRRLKLDRGTVDIPVVFLSAIHRNAGAKAMSESVGAKALLFYPVEADQLLAVLEGQVIKARLE